MLRIVVYQFYEFFLQNSQIKNNGALWYCLLKFELSDVDRILL